MQIGLQLPSFKVSGGTAAIRPKLKEVVRAAEDGGFYSLWVMDHFYQIRGLFGEAYTDPMLEAYTALGFLAGVSERLMLGALVTGVIYRHPSVLLKMMNTLDIVSGGRGYLGIGAAWYEGEAEGFGVPYPDTKTRFEWLEEALQMAHALWSSDETTFNGAHFNAPKLTNNPRPLSQPHPRIMIGGTGPNKTLRMVAQYADACNIFMGGGVDAVRGSLDTLKGHCERLGRDYATIEKTTLGTVYLAAGHETVEGTLEKLRQLSEIGVTHVIVNMPNVYEIAPLEIFARDIIPQAAQWS
ncbi:MAG: TIGR03560 family F420-dependent LLM class oxidoreductase [Chloroflexi bacterium]|nr:TIGR03560 family F420-dependent LLM class oxidoreductase [Chloroflexota bacterium]